MAGRMSQNTRTRHPRPARERRPQALLCLVAGLTMLAAILTLAAWFPESELGRTIGAHLAQRANLESWIP